jgi:hypothetical protein
MSLGINEEESQMHLILKGTCHTLAATDCPSPEIKPTRQLTRAFSAQALTHSHSACSVP